MGTECFARRLDVEEIDAVVSRDTAVICLHRRYWILFVSRLSKYRLRLEEILFVEDTRTAAEEDWRRLDEDVVMVVSYN